jgi:hypothetical protein
MTGTAQVIRANARDLPLDAHAVEFLRPSEAPLKPHRHFGMATGRVSPGRPHRKVGLGDQDLPRTGSHMRDVTLPHRLDDGAVVLSEPSSSLGHRHHRLAVDNLGNVPATTATLCVDRADLERVQCLLSLDPKVGQQLLAHPACLSGSSLGTAAHLRERVVTGYACDCPEPTAPTTPSVILDPFGGTGTTAMVAKALGRHGISVDMSADYCRLAEWRTNDPKQLAKAARKPYTPSEKPMDGQGDLLDLLDGEAS